MAELQCREVRDLLPELAAGVASGEMRAAALAHLAGCAECRAELDEVAATVDELLLLAPEREPPAGFDLRVISSLGGARPDSHRLRDSLMLAAAFVLIAGAAGGIAWATGGDDRSLADQYRDTLAVADGSAMRAADITAGGTTYGDVFVYEGHPSWLFLTMAAPGSGSYPVRLVTTDGQSVRLGTCTLRDGVGHWGTIIDVPLDSIEQVQLERVGYPTMVADFS